MTDKLAPAPPKGVGGQTDDPTSKGSKKVSSKPSTSTNKRDLRSSEEKEKLQRRFEELVKAGKSPEEIMEELDLTPAQFNQCLLKKAHSDNFKPAKDITVKASSSLSDKLRKFIGANKDDEIKVDRTQENGKFILQIIKATESPLNDSTGENSDP